MSPIIKCLIFVKKFYEAKQRKNLNDTPIKQFMTPNKPKTSLCIGGITWSASSRVFNINYQRNNTGLLELFNQSPQKDNNAVDLEAKVMEVNAIKVELAKKVKQLTEEKEAILGAYQSIFF